MNQNRIEIRGDTQLCTETDTQKEKQIVTYWYICCLTSCLLHFFHAELGCGHCSWVMGWCIICEQEVTSSEDGAHTLLSCFTDLRGKHRRKNINIKKGTNLKHLS